MDLDSINYAELQRLAKDAGLKANIKADKLRKTLKQHFEGQQDGDVNVNVSEGMAAQVEVDPKEEEAAEPEMEAAVFVTKRRGRASKRKHGEEAAAEPSTHMLPLYLPEEKGPETGSAKRCRLSASQDLEMPKSAETTEEVSEEVQPDGTEGVQESHDKGEKKVAKAGRIPRHEGLLKKNRNALKPITPNFKKLHEAHFNKMESIDSYVQRKTKQVEAFKSSVKELKLLSDKTIPEPTNGKTQAKPRGRVTLFSPAPVDKKPATVNHRHTQLSTNKPAAQDGVPFRPSVLSTRRINVRFSQATSNDEKSSLVKTPARMSSVKNPRFETPGKNGTVGGKPETKVTALSSTTTPGSTFYFTGDTTISNTPGTNKKPAFDLKASLSRPLNYKPHKGKLKPFGSTQDNSAANQPQTVQSHQKNVKRHQVQTREERRTKHQENRKQKKENLLGARRGLIMS